MITESEINAETSNWLRKHKADLNQELKQYGDEHRILANFLQHPESLEEIWNTLLQAVEKSDPPHKVMNNLRAITKSIAGEHGALSDSDRHHLSVLAREGEKLRSSEERLKLLNEWLSEPKLSPEVSARIAEYRRMKLANGSKGGTVAQPDAWYHRCGFCGAIGLAGGQERGSRFVSSAPCSVRTKPQHAAHS